MAKVILKHSLIAGLVIAVMMTFIPLIPGLSGDVSAATKLAAPKSVKAKTLSETSVKVSWGKVKGAKGYTVYQKKGSKFKAIKTTSKKTLTVKKLKAGTKYTFYVKAYKKNGKKKVYGKASKKVSATTKASKTAVMTKNGNMKGTYKNGVSSFKGVPFAKPPVGELRWKKPVAPDPSTKDVDATEYGYAAMQSLWHSEGASFHEQSEDCLTLNIWTKSANDKKAKKPVMVFIHGGAHGWGGTTDSLYDGQKFVEANGDDVLLVTVNYRLNMLGFIDLSSVPGGENYPDAPWLGLYDNIRALEWIQENITQFGGDPDNVTIFGESAGGAQVSLLPVMDEAAGLFHKVIAESGSVNLTDSVEDCQELTQIILEKTGAKNMDDLVALDEKQIKELVDYTLNYGDEGVYNFPMRDGKVLPLTNKELQEAYAKSPAKDIIYMCGTNENEWNYWFGEMTGKDVEGALPTQEDYDIFWYLYNDSVNEMIEAGDEDMALFKQKLEARGITESIYQTCQYINEVIFRIPAISSAENHAGKTYMYYWKQPSTIVGHYDALDIDVPYGACHAIELAYVLNNLDQTVFCGPNPDPALAKKVQEAWVSFAKTGTPHVEGEPDWPEYDKDTRATMVINNTAVNEHWTVENDPLGDEREIFQNGGYCD